MGARIFKYRSHIYLTLALLSVVGLYTLYERRPRAEALTLIPAQEAVCAATPTVEPTVSIRVHVVGAVAAPGVYTLESGARIIDAVQAAGGMTAVADAEGVNLADRVADGQQVRVPLVGAAPQPSLTPMPPGEGSSGAATASGAATRINVNAASAVELEQLPGIGPVLAQRIVDYRRDKGPFAAVEDLLQVQGIGDAILARIRDLVTVR
jgi:competence protein ComEA